MKIRFIFVLAIVTILSKTAFTAADLNFLITSNSNDLALEADEISYIYLGKRTLWTNGTSILPYRLPDNNNATKKLLNEFLEMSKKEYSDYWRKKLFTGELLPPVVVQTEQELVSKVCKQIGAIGFVSSQMELPNNCRYIRIKN